MKLTGIKVKNYRSIFPGEGHESFVIDLAEGMNTFVGPTTAGSPTSSGPWRSL